MPTYEYRCKDCGEDLEVVQSFTDDPLDTCPACGGALKKVFGSVGISFKGSGFYKTDSRGSSTKTAASTAGDSSSSSSDTSGASEGSGSSSTTTSSDATSSGSGSNGSTSDSKPSDPKPSGKKETAPA